MSFEPIAIVGQACTLPGAHEPQTLWKNVLAGASSLSRVPPGRWGLPAAQALGTVAQSADRTWSDVGGYVSDFDARFDPTGFRLPADEVRALDPVFQLTLHVVREALRSAGLDGAGKGAGLVMGNLSFPSAAMARYAQAVWFGEASRPHPRNRFNSGLPAHLAAKALGLERGAFALDAACASSLYAIKLACDRLHDRAADVMVAGAVNAADDLFIHVGFCALSAMSKTGQSRPFHRDADGLVPAEGAGFVVLMRLTDALAQGRTVLGVIRGVGLSNDGRGRGLLAPSEEGQERALRLAYEAAGLAPSSVGLVECHATGTPVGDATELRSMARVFAGCRDVPIGSLKSNLGHLITAAGVAGLLKVLAAMEHGVRPPTLHVEQPNEALGATPFRLLTQAEPWTGPRRAGVSAFGFGGNNAHLVVEALEETQAAKAHVVAAPRRAEVAIVGIGARVGSGDSAVDFARSLFAGEVTRAPREKVAVALEGLRFPPNDLQQALGQQTMVLEAAREAAKGVTLPRERTSVLIGMGCDAEVARYGARWRLAQEGADAAWLAKARDAVVPVLQAPGVLGTMPNIPANRINSQLDVAGPAFTVSAEEASGVMALELAARALRAGEIDAALVGAVDLSHEPVHQAALAELGRAAAPGDAAVVLTLKRLEDAKRDGDPIFATLVDETVGASTESSWSSTLHVGRGSGALVLGDATGAVDLTAAFGRPHAATGLLHVAAAALALRQGLVPHVGNPASPWSGARVAKVEVSVLEGSPARVTLSGGSASPPMELTAPKLAGPALELAAHPPPVRKLPPPAIEHREAESARPAAVPGTQYMAPPPALEPLTPPSARRVRPGTARRPVEVARAPRSVAAPVSGPPAPPNVAVAASGGALRGNSAPSGAAVPPAPIVAVAPSSATVATTAGSAVAQARSPVLAVLPPRTARLAPPEPGMSRRGLFGGVAPSERVPFFASRSGPPAARPTSVAGAAAPRPVSQGTPAMNDALARLAAQQAQLAEVHRQFLEQQAALHEEFLATQRAAEAALLNAYAAVTGSAVLPGAVPTALPASVPPPLAAPVAAPPPPVVAAPAPVVAPASPSIVSSAPPAPPAVKAPERPALPPTQAKPSMTDGVGTAPPKATPPPEVLPGPKFSRAQLEVLASGKISSVFGPQFEGQDGYARQVRMPEPPLLLADRVTGIDAVPGSMGKGTIWTETDVKPDSWYLDDEGRMPAGIMIESGQADLLLISWLGIDALNKGERVYRLLGCDLTYHGGLPVPGDTLQYDIHVDGHAQQGDVRLFFFHYDCQIRGETRLTVRNGQAGFFTDEELANSAGVLWSPEDEPPAPAQVDPPAVPCTRTRLSAEQLRAFAAGRPYDCFGPGWELTRTHVRTPRITAEKMQFLHEVTELNPTGGPWGRGYLRAETPVTPDDWFFKGHFKNDPCMPGTLMFEGCLQAMSVYLASLGFTVERDAWRFEPVTGNRIPMRCRGQVTPSSKHLVYEVFVSEVIAGPIPTVYADLLCTVDGRKAFHAKRVGLRLVPDWPMTHWKHLGPAQSQKTGELVPLRQLSGLVGYEEPKPVATVDGFPFDYHSLLACAWGPPSQAFGPFYARFDGTRRAARLPGPPYHFMSRVTKVDGPIGGMKPGTSVEVEYDVPVEQWYFEENGHRTMPFCVLMEAALQPCGWLASYVGSALTTDVDLLFRNLDGTGTQLVDVLPGAGAFTTKVKLLSISQSAGMIIESFDVTCSIGGTPVFNMKTVFGFFPKEAFENQVGLPVTPEERARFTAPPALVADLTARPAKYCAGAPRLAGDMLLMLDRVTEWTPTGGSKGLGYLRGEKTVDVDEWFFKAHFFQDPVQPGSLGVEALLQLLQFFMLGKGLAEGVENPRFEPIMLGKPVTWKYRGQVVPKNKVIGSEIEIIEVGRDEKGVFAIANGWLWVDGKRIYSTNNMGMRIVPGGAKVEPPKRDAREEVLDPAKDTWLLDHCPTWTMPALPMMSMVDRLVAAAESESGRTMRAVRDVQVHRWLPLPGGLVRLKTEVTGTVDERTVTLLAWRDAQDAALSRFEPVATGRVLFAPQGPAPAPFVALSEAADEANPYASGALFHGPAFQYLTALKLGASGSTATLDAARGSVPKGALHQGLLDAATHAIPHDWLSRWSSQIPGDVVAYPYRLKELRRFAPLPEKGQLRLETRFAGFDGEPRFPMLDVQVLDGSGVILDFRLVEVLLPRGPIGAAPRDARRAFLRDRRFVPGVALSSGQGDATRLSQATLKQSDWLPGNVAAIYGVPADRRGELLTEVAVRDHVARRAFVHPSTVTLEADGARAAMRPLRLHPVAIERAGDEVTVRDAAPPRQDLARVKAWWRKRFDVGEWPVEDLYYGLVQRFVGDVVLADPEAFARVKGRSCLYLANHQVGVESLLFSVLVSALSETPTVTVAKAEHRTSWLGTLIAHNFSYPGVVDPKVITFFDRDDKESLLRIVGELGAEMKASGKGVMVHVEGTRSLACGAPVEKMSSAFLDMALAVGAPIVPVRFVGGLPREALAKRLEFPLGLGKQDYWVGRPILPEELTALPLKERKAAVLAAMNALGPPLAEEQPFPGDAQLVADVEAWRARTGCSEEDAVLFVTLATQPKLQAEARRLVDGARAWKLVVGGDAKSQWLTGLARRFFGPKGPAIVGPA
jgi:3-oxoacyl-(acyl-carrier-protein) synthase/3-hydroxymyristoyl/3-hydroxydecanoyl-(acyl carrier protein) dehydratase/1-acyl-sn-glycerol-3-phosphate acyltransferase